MGKIINFFARLFSKAPYDPVKEAQEEKTLPSHLQEKPPKIVIAAPAIDPQKWPAVAPYLQKRYYDRNGLFLISEDGLQMCKHFEGRFPRAYRDPVGVITIGYGRIRYPNGKSVQMGDTCTEEQMTEWLLQDLFEEGAKYVRNMLVDESKLSEHQFSALVDFTFNRGAGRFDEKLDDFIDSALVDGVIDYGEVARITNVLLTYDYAGKGSARRVLPGLSRRRYAEREMFAGKDWRRFSDSKTWKSEIY